MPSIRYINQSAPFWDFVANLENEGVNHPFFGGARQPESGGEDGQAGPPHYQGPWGPHGGFPHRPHPYGRHGGRHHRGGPPPPPGEDDDVPPPPFEEHEGSPATAVNEKDEVVNEKGESSNEKAAARDQGEGSDSDSKCRHGPHGRHGRHGAFEGKGRHGGFEGRGCHGGFGGKGRHGPCDGQGCQSDCEGKGRRHGGFGGRSGGGPCGRRGGPGGFGGRHHGGGPFGGRGGFPFAHFMPAFPPQFANFWGQNKSGEEGEENSSEENTFKPDADVFDTENAYVVHLSLPGAKKEELSVSWDAEKSELAVYGVVTRPGDEEFLKTLAMQERKIGIFDRRLRLGTLANPAQIDVDAITAKLEEGILRIEVPKLDRDYVEVKMVDIE